MKKVLTCLIFLICGLQTISAETITGSACYRFSDNESMAAARDIALSMAKRTALEGYSVFVSSTSTVENMVLKNDLIASLTAGLLKHLRVTDKTEDLHKKEVCRTIQAEVEPFEIKSRITSKINTYRRKHANFKTGLPESYCLKALKTTVSDGKLELVVECKEACRGLLYGRITYYDEEGIPEGMHKHAVYCRDKGDIGAIYLNLPKNPKATYSFDLLR
jgi:hypothetical protein